MRGGGKTTTPSDGCARFAIPTCESKGRHRLSNSANVSVYLTLSSRISSRRCGSRMRSTRRDRPAAPRSRSSSSSWRCSDISPRALPGVSSQSARASPSERWFSSRRSSCIGPCALSSRDTSARPIRLRRSVATRGGASQAASDPWMACTLLGTDAPSDRCNRSRARRGTRRSPSTSSSTATRAVNQSLRLSLDARTTRPWFAPTRL